MFNLIRISACLTTCCALTSFAFADELFFAIDAPTHSLVVVELESGIVTPIGEVKTPVGFISDLAVVGEKLYALEVDYAPPSTTAWLIELDVNCGQILSRTPVSHDGSTIFSGALEGLARSADGASPDTPLTVAFNIGDVHPSYSNTIGLLALDGTLTNVASYSGQLDADGLTASATGGGYFAVDNDPQSNFSILAINTGVTKMGSPFPGQVKNSDGIVDSGTWLYCIDRTTNEIHRLDRTTAAHVESFPFEAGYTLNTIELFIEGMVKGDLNCDGSVGVADLLILLGAWGTCDDQENCPADLDGDNAVGVSDLLILLANWG